MVERVGDTVVAPITAVGGAVALVRVSGPLAFAVGATVFSPWPSPVVPRTSLYGRFQHGDDGLLVAFESGASYTGEESVEMSVHGSPASVFALVSACCAAGARPAEPGEFTLRAFQNGRLDLTQAEGVRTLVEAQSEAALRQGRLLREGRLSREVKSVRESVLGVLASVEASTDFSEEVGPLDRRTAASRIAEAAQEIDRLLATASASRLAHQGITVAIVGRPNAGKSSLFNAILQADRAIVTPVPGTTRDALHETLQVGGVIVRLVDTAGLRETDDQVEAIGVERSLAAATDADLVLYVYDASVGYGQEEARYFDSIERPKQAVANKRDLPHDDGPGIPTQATNGLGVDDVLAFVASHAQGALAEQPYILPRHVTPLREARQALDEVAQTLSVDVPDDLATVGLRSSARALGEITGETATPDVIDRIFHDFCIGK